MLGPFHSLLLLSLLWVFVKSFGIPWTNYHILYFGFIGIWINPIYYFLTLGSSSPFLLSFLFLMIPMGLLLHPLGLPRPVLLSLRPLIILWACEPSFLLFWPNGPYFTIFFLHLYHIVGLLLPLGPFVKNELQHIHFTNMLLLNNLIIFFFFFEKINNSKLVQ